MEEKENSILPSSTPSSTPPPKSHQRKNKNVWVEVVIICFLVFRATYHFWNATDKTPRTPSDNCPQADVLIPEKNGEIWTELNNKIGSAAFKQTAIDWLAGAVRIP
jgi:Gly-Xaa carboxypeptidase